MSFNNQTIIEAGLNFKELHFVNTCTNCETSYRTAATHIHTVFGKKGKKVTNTCYDYCPECGIQNVQTLKEPCFIVKLSLSQRIKQFLLQLRSHFVDNLKV